MTAKPAAESGIDPGIARRLAFARQKTREIAVLARGLGEGTDAVAAELAANRADLASRAGSAITRDPAVRARTAAITDADGRRSQPYVERTVAQRARLGLPPLPTTTIGSFPQTAELRTARADLRAGRIDTAGYEERISDEIREVLSFQEKAGIDVLVHGEPERKDTVQYFAEQLTGYLATQHGRPGRPPRVRRAGRCPASADALGEAEETVRVVTPLHLHQPPVVLAVIRLLPVRQRRIDEVLIALVE